MYNTEVKTITKSLPLLRWNTCKSLIFSYSAYFSRIFEKNTCQNSMVNVLDKDKILWYVMRAYKNENTAEDRLSNETYGLEYFIPKQKVLRTVKGKKVFFKEIYIETERIIIRNFKQKDAEGLLEYLSHPRVNCFAGDRLCSREAAWAYMQYSPKDMLRYAVSLKKDDPKIRNYHSIHD